MTWYNVSKLLNDYLQNFTIFVIQQQYFKGVLMYRVVL